MKRRQRRKPKPVPGLYRKLAAALGVQLPPRPPAPGEQLELPRPPAKARGQDAR